MVIVHVYCSDLNPKWQKQEAPKCENGILCHADIFCVALIVFSLKRGSKSVFSVDSIWIFLLLSDRFDIDLMVTKIKSIKMSQEGQPPKMLINKFFKSGMYSCLTLSYKGLLLVYNCFWAFVEHLICMNNQVSDIGSA